jgi:hypothetical protein
MTPKPRLPGGSATTDARTAVSLAARLGGALLLQALVAGLLISLLLHPPAAVGAVIASVALAACVVRRAWEDADR